jgi:hypothetical protein
MMARTHQFAIVLGAIKDKPSRAREMRVLDRPCARRRRHPVVGMKVSLRRGRTKVIGFAAVDGRRLGPARAPIIKDSACGKDGPRSFAELDARYWRA